MKHDPNLIRDLMSKKPPPSIAAYFVCGDEITPFPSVCQRRGLSSSHTRKLARQVLDTFGYHGT